MDNNNDKWITLGVVFVLGAILGVFILGSLVEKRLDGIDARDKTLACIKLNNGDDRAIAECIADE